MQYRVWICFIIPIPYHTKSNQIITYHPIDKQIYNIVLYIIWMIFNTIVHHIIYHSMILYYHFRTYHHNPCTIYKINHIQFWMVLYWIVVCFGRIRLVHQLDIRPPKQVSPNESTFWILLGWRRVTSTFHRRHWGLPAGTFPHSSDAPEVAVDEVQ